MYDVPLFFSQNDFKQAIEKIDFYDELICSVKNLDSFCLFFQPIINPKTDTIRSAEALLRWENPASYKYGLENIIKVLESTGLILPLRKVDNFHSFETSVENGQNARLCDMSH